MNNNMAEKPLSELGITRGQRPSESDGRGIATLNGDAKTLAKKRQQPTPSKQPVFPQAPTPSVVFNCPKRHGSQWQPGKTNIQPRGPRISNACQPPLTELLTPPPKKFGLGVREPGCQGRLSPKRHAFRGVTGLGWLRQAACRLRGAALVA